MMPNLVLKKSKNYFTNSLKILQLKQKQKWQMDREKMQNIGNCIKRPPVEKKCDTTLPINFYTLHFDAIYRLVYVALNELS